MDFETALAESREGPAFSNGTEGYGWQAEWCGTCQRDQIFRNMGKGSGCPLLLIALHGNIPAEWDDGPRDDKGLYSIPMQYTCTKYLPVGSRRSSSNRKRRPADPPGMDALFSPEVSSDGQQ